MDGTTVKTSHYLIVKGDCRTALRAALWWGVPPDRVRLVRYIGAMRQTCLRWDDSDDVLLSRWFCSDFPVGDAGEMPEYAAGSLLVYSEISEV